MACALQQQQDRCRQRAPCSLIAVRPTPVPHQDGSVGRGHHGKARPTKRQQIGPSVGPATESQQQINSSKLRDQHTIAGANKHTGIVHSNHCAACNGHTSRSSARYSIANTIRRPGGPIQAPDGLHNCQDSCTCSPAKPATFQSCCQAGNTPDIRQQLPGF